MALTVSTVNKGRSRDVFGRREVGLFRVTFDNSYPAGGEPFDPAAQGFSKPVQQVHITQRAPLTGAYAFVYDHANKKILAFVEEAVAAGGPLPEVADTTDLSAVVVDVFIIGE